jgi:hypothetical protein
VNTSIQTIQSVYDTVRFLYPMIHRHETRKTYQRRTCSHGAFGHSIIPFAFPSPCLGLDPSDGYDDQ